MAKTTYSIDGENFSTLDEFFDEFKSVLTPDYWWGKNLDAFNDVLVGGFGTPGEDYVLIWKNSKLSKERLGYGETLKELESMLRKCHPTARSIIAEELRLAKAQTGPTVFDWIVDAIRKQNPKIDLILE